MTETFIATRPLPVGSKGHHASGWWGMLALIMSEAALFAYLFFSYFYLASHAVGLWPPNGPPDLTIAVPGTLILIAGSVAMWWGERGIEHGRPGRLMGGLVAALVLGFSFIVMELKEWSGQPFTLSTSVYSSLYFTITGFHLLHVAVGMFMLAALLIWAALGYFDAARHSAVSVGGIYWHFVTLVWLAGCLLHFLHRAAFELKQMPENALPSQTIHHPAPHRARVTLSSLWFGLSAAPLAWSLQLLCSTALTGRDCFPHQAPLAEPSWPGLWPVLLAISLAGITLAIAGGRVAWRNWQRTREELPGSAHRLLDSGEGRTRFMGMSGVIASALFLIALVFGTVSLFMVPLCGG